MIAELGNALTGVGVAFLAILSLALGTALPYVPKIMKAILDRILAQIEASRASTLKAAGETAAASVEETAKAAGWKGGEKRAEAQRIVQSIAPNAVAAAPAGAVADVVAAGVAKLRASVPTGDQLAVVRLSSPPSVEALHGQVPLPAPAKMPEKPPSGSP